MSRGWFRDVKIYVEWENEKYAKYFFFLLEEVSGGSESLVSEKTLLWK